jgi:hypothetical protein
LLSLMNGCSIVLAELQGPSMQRGGGNTAHHTRAFSSNTDQDHDFEHEHDAMSAPNFPMGVGGLKTSKAAKSKAFDFDLPMDAEESNPATEETTAAAVAAPTVATAAPSSNSPVRPTALIVDASLDEPYAACGIAVGGSAGGSAAAAARRPSRDDEHLSLSGQGSGDSHSRRNSNGQILPMLLHSRTSPSVSQRTTASPFSEVQPASSQKISPRAENYPPNPAKGLLASLNVSTGGVQGMGIAGMGGASVHANSATFLHSMNSSPHSTSNSARSEDSPSPRIHIPPHRLQQQQQLDQLNAALLNTASPRSFALYQQYPRPQSAEKRRWLARINLLRNQHSSPVPGSDGHHSGADDFAGAMQIDGAGSDSVSSGDVKVARMAEADDTASQMVYGGAEKYFYVEYLEWMGAAVHQPGVESGDICCNSCKNVLGAWMWNPSSR